MSIAYFAHKLDTRQPDSGLLISVIEKNAQIIYTCAEINTGMYKSDYIVDIRISLDFWIEFSVPLIRIVCSVLYSLSKGYWILKKHWKNTEYWQQQNFDCLLGEFVVGQQLLCDFVLVFPISWLA